MSKKLKIPLDKSLYYAIIGKSLRDIRVWRSLVARLTGGQEAAGSSPVTRTIVSIHNTSEYSLFFFTFPHS